MRQLRDLRESFQDIAFDWEAEKYGLQVNPNTTTQIDLGEYAITPEEFDEFVCFLEMLPKLTKVDMYETSLKTKNNINKSLTCTVDVFQLSSL
jgi:hypothetical protein